MKRVVQVFNVCIIELEENEVNYEAKALSIFQLNNADIEHPYYSVHISNAILFQLIVSYVGCGISFRQCVQIVSKTKEILGIGNIGCINVGKVILHVWYLKCEQSSMGVQCLRY